MYKTKLSHTACIMLIGISLLCIPAFYSCNGCGKPAPVATDSTVNSTTKIDSPAIAPVDTTIVDTIKGGQNPPPPHN